MGLRYSGVISRTLERAERRVQINEEETPLVIEPRESSSAAFLLEFLAHHSSQLLEDIAKFGALLIRGFDVESSHDFEKQILSIRGMHGIKEMLFSEPGRTIADGTDFVFHTNSLMKTGGTLQFGRFHTENYYVPDVPRYISFLCQTPSRLGGETGLVNLAKVYADLPNPLKQKLEETTCFVKFYSLAEMVARYGVRAEVISEFCKDTGLPIATIDNAQYVVIYKPSVIQHPLTDERALLINFSSLPAVQRPLMKMFAADYSGARWLLHKLFWAAPWLQLVCKPRTAAHLVSQQARQLLRGKTKAVPRVIDARPLHALFSTREIQMLAESIRRRYSSFLWKRRDILIVDNLKMAHNGMPGRGERELKAMMCNPVALPSVITSPGLYAVPHSENSRECLGAQLVHLRDRAGNGLMTQT